MTTISIIFFVISVTALVISFVNYKKSKSKIEDAKTLLKSAEFSLNSSGQINKETKDLLDSYYDSKDELEFKNNVNKEMLQFYMKYSDNLEDTITKEMDNKKDYIGNFIQIQQRKNENEITKPELNFIIKLIADYFKIQMNFDKIKINFLENQIAFSQKRVERRKSKNQNIEKELHLIESCNDLIKTMQTTVSAIEGKLDSISSYSDKDGNTEVLINLLIDIMEMRMNAFPEESKSSKVGSYKITKHDKELAEKTKNDFLKTLEDNNSDFVFESKTKNKLENFILTLNSLIETNCDDDNKWIAALDLIPEVMNEEECKIWGMYYKGVLSSKTYKNFNSENYQNLSSKEKWVFNSIMKIENSLKNNSNG